MNKNRDRKKKTRRPSARAAKDQASPSWSFADGNVSWHLRAPTPAKDDGPSTPIQRAAQTLAGSLRNRSVQGALALVVLDVVLPIVDILLKYGESQTETPDVCAPAGATIPAWQTTPNHLKLPSFARGGVGLGGLGTVMCPCLACAASRAAETQKKLRLS